MNGESGESIKGEDVAEAGKGKSDRDWDENDGEKYGST